MTYPSAVREALLARVAAGERVSHVCRAPGMPCHEAVTGWARRDAWFGQRYAQAKAKGEWLRKAGFDEARAGELLRRLAEGEKVKEMLVGPDTPSRETWWLWRRTQGEFAQALARINADKREQVAAMRRRDSYRHFDQALADRIVARVAAGATLRSLKRLYPELPGQRVVARWRRQNREFDRVLKWAFGVALAAERRGRKCNAATIEAIAERVMDGATLAAIGRDPSMPCATTMYAWLRTRWEFREAVGMALRARGDRLADEALDAVLDGRPGRGRRFQALRRKTERMDARAARAGRRST